MDAMSVHLDNHSAARLETPIKATEAIEENLARDTWQIAEIEQAITEANAGNFVAADEIDELFKKLGETTQHRN